MRRAPSRTVAPIVIRTLLVDDEALARRGVRQLLAAHVDVEIVGECGDGPSAIAAMEARTPDLVFLDIQMPECDGFTVLRTHAERRGIAELPLTVFLTAYEEFALDAFDVEAVDYLVKPVSEERFEEAMRRVRRRLALPADAARGAVAVRRDDEAPSARQLVVATATGQRVVMLDEVDWIAANDYYVTVHAAGRRYLLRESLASLEERLDPARFIRVHRGAIVSIARVREVRSAGADVVVLQDGTKLPVSRRRRAALVAAVVAR
jgi:two-component system LytT family response regulator